MAIAAWARLSPLLDGLLAGQTLRTYVLTREISHGGMGTVRLAARADGRFEGQAIDHYCKAGK